MIKVPGTSPPGVNYLILNRSGRETIKAIKEVKLLDAKRGKLLEDQFNILLTRLNEMSESERTYGQLEPLGKPEARMDLILRQVRMLTDELRSRKCSELIELSQENALTHIEGYAFTLELCIEYNKALYEHIQKKISYKV